MFDANIFETFHENKVKYVGNALSNVCKLS